MSDAIVRRLDIPAGHPAFDGHFPGQPILPGVALLAEVLEAVLDEPVLAASVGAEPRLVVAKFLAAVRPGAALTVGFRVGARTLDWTVSEGAQAAASGQFARAGPAGADAVRGQLT
jgi:3-hydroxymyristoyl/3-hydroxydecanoyl-(acyl carrier protein) dehydratase